MALTLKKAFEESIVKWEYLSKCDYKGKLHWTEIERKLTTDIPRLEKYSADCGLCEFYRNTCSDGCPIRDGRWGCVGDEHPFHIWITNPNKKNAKRVLALIRNKKKEMKL